MNFLSCFIIDEEPSIAELRNSIAEMTGMVLLGASNQPQKVLTEIMSKLRIDILFMNAKLFNSLETTLLNRLSLMGISIILTSDDDPQFTTNTTASLRSNYSYTEFLEAVITVLRIPKKPMKAKSAFYVQNGVKGHVYKIRYQEVNYIEAAQNYINIVLDDRTVSTHQTLKSVEAQLPSDDFLRVHKSFIVNEAKLQAIANDELTLYNGSKIKIGASYRQYLLDRLLY